MASTGIGGGASARGGQETPHRPAIAGLVRWVILIKD